MQPQTPPLFAQELGRIAGLVEQELRRFFATRKERAAQLDADHLHVVELLEEMVLRGGKRIRPYLCWCGYTLAGGKEEGKIIRVGAALELLHNYLLNLDDIADRDTVRHGGPTLEVQYSETLFAKYTKSERMHYARSWAEIAGAILNSYIYELLLESEFDASLLVRVMHSVNTTMLEDTAVGWQIQMAQNHQSFKEVTEERFTKGLQLVTAQYTFIGPLVIGATLAQASPDTINTLKTYGMEVGTGFQMHDDVLGLFGDPKETGKAVGNDAREGKKTLLLQYAYRHASKQDQAFLTKNVGTNITEKELSRVQEIVRGSGALAYSEKKAKEHVEKGLKALSTLSLNKAIQQQLTEIAYYVVQRKK